MGDDLTLLGEWEAIMTAERMLSRVFVPVDPTVDQMVIVKERTVVLVGVSGQFIHQWKVCLYHVKETVFGHWNSNRTEVEFNTIHVWTKLVVESVPVYS